MWKKALDVLEDMKQNGVIPNDFTYSAAITACGNGGQWERALDLIDKASFALLLIAVLSIFYLHH